MRPTLDNSKYPVFEANQVLTNRHLNQVFSYLDEQERLTRANLIGNGIVCGLEIQTGGTASSPTVRIGKGCGITSEGYLIVEPADVELVSYRPYVVPDDLPYPLFAGVPLWEMFPAGEPNSTPFSSAPTDFLKDKVVLLFLELEKNGLRNCSPTNCDDRGAEVRITLRRLLVSRNDPKITRLIDGSIATTPLPTLADLEQALTADLKLDDIRLPRYSVPAGNLPSSNAVLAAFYAVFHQSSLAARVGNALTAAYNAFHPLLIEWYPANPFTGFAAKFGFLDIAPQNTTQVGFLQYYYDLFDDLIKAYDEFRRHGAELMCACCPPDGLFPRHLLLGMLYPENWTANDPAIFRHFFRHSAATGGCEERVAEIQLLFRRLVEMTVRFTDEPPLFRTRGPENLQQQIRITPSKLGDFPLSEKCIPYYYLQNGTPRLFELWNAEKNRRKRAFHNLGYRTYEYGISPLPDFVANPLRYDLEPSNFLRIEGHLGKNYLQATQALLALRDQNRLPIEVIALRTGAFDETATFDPARESARFQDLETTYDVLREDILNTLCEGIMYLYGVNMSTTEPGGATQLPLLKKYKPGHKYAVGTVGAWYEKNLSLLRAMPYIDVNSADGVDPSEVLGIYCSIFSTAPAPPAEFQPHVVSIYYMVKLSEILPASLDKLGFLDFQNKYGDLVGLLRYFRSEAAASVSPQFEPFVPKEELIDHCDQVLFSCKTEPMRAVYDEYSRRVREIKQKQFFSNFLQKHPGIQHKAGVPLGGTFVLIYHDDPEGRIPAPDLGEFASAQLYSEITIGVSQEAVDKDTAYAARTGRPAVLTPEFESAFKRLQVNPEFAQDEDFRLITGALTGQVFNPTIHFDLLFNESANKVIAQYVNGLSDGTVIADFFLPYLCCSDCAGVQYVLPPTLPNFTYSVRCTNDVNQAEVVITAQGGTPGYSYKVGTQDFLPLTGAVVLTTGAHTLVVRDAAGTESGPQEVVIPSKLSFAALRYRCLDGLKTYVAEFDINGGTPPYTASRGSVNGTNKYTSDPIATGTSDTIVIIDNKGCRLPVPVIHTCADPLSFSLVAECTAGDRQAPVRPEIAGGIKPYKIKVDDGDYTTVPERLTLVAGPHKVTVLDASGIEKTTSITIADPIFATVLAGDYTCNKEGTQYKARVTINGGTPPYKVNGKEAEGNFYFYGPAPSGKSEVLRIIDSRGCEAPPLTVQYRCLSTRVVPTFDYVLSPTGADNKAKLTLAPGDGTPPFKYRLNDGDFVPLEAPIVLSPGRYAITLKDNLEILSETKTIEVPQADAAPLLLINVNHKCEGGKYRVFFQLTGGHPPYRVVRGEVAPLGADSFETMPVPSGVALGVEMADSTGNMVTQEFRFVCETGCDKPCGGISRKCAYPLWIQPSSGNFGIYKPGDVSFTFTDEKGKTQTIPGLSIDALPEMLNKDFHGVIGALVRQLNEKVAKALGAGRLVLSYEPTDGDPFARIWVEYFECESFNFKFQITYTQGSKQVREYEVNYLKAGDVNAVLITNLQEDREPLRIAAFDCQVRDQCKGTPAEPVCKGVSARIAFRAVQEAGKLSLTALSSGVGTNGISTWIWVIENAPEPFYTGSNIALAIPVPTTGITVKLIGISRQGCYQTTQQKVSPQK